MAEDKDKAAEPEEQEQAVVAFYYDSTANPTGAGYPGVPLRNLLQHEVDQYPKWIQENLKGSPMYSAEPPGKKPVKGKESEK